MIVSFVCKDTKRLFNGDVPSSFSGFSKIALRKLDMLDAAVSLQDLTIPPGNRLEALSGGRNGQYSIRINDRWRICFIWNEGQVENVAIVDYH